MSKLIPKPKHPYPLVAPKAITPEVLEGILRRIYHTQGNTRGSMERQIETTLLDYLGAEELEEIDKIPVTCTDQRCGVILQKALAKCFSAYFVCSNMGKFASVKRGVKRIRFCAVVPAGFVSVDCGLLSAKTRYEDEKCIVTSNATLELTSNSVAKMDTRYHNKLWYQLAIPSDRPNRASNELMVRINKAKTVMQIECPNFTDAQAWFYIVPVQLKDTYISCVTYTRALVAMIWDWHEMYQATYTDIQITQKEVKKS